MRDAWYYARSVPGATAFPWRGGPSLGDIVTRLVLAAQRDAVDAAAAEAEGIAAEASGLLHRGGLINDDRHTLEVQMVTAAAIATKIRGLRP